MSRRLVILGSGTSFGVPVIGCACAVCRSSDPRDRRTRSAAVIEVDGTRLLIDTPPELRLQLLGQGIGTVDAVLYTHGHADHTHGIDDLRAISQRAGRLTLYGPPETLGQLEVRFRYIFDATVVPPPGTSKPVLAFAPLEPFAPVRIGAAWVVPLELDHGGTRVFGYRVGEVAYVTDAKSVPPRALEAMRGVRILVVNALFERPHATHLSIPEAVELSRQVGARATYLTHLTHRHAHAELEARLPAGVQPAYDGLIVEF